MHNNLRFYLIYLFKIVVILILLLSLYYLLVLRPKINEQKLINQTKLTLGILKDNLVQNKLSFVQLAKLDSNSANFDIERSNITASLKESNKKGLEDLNNKSHIPTTDLRLKERFPQLIYETRQIYEEQNKLLERVFETKSYEEGVRILKSNEAVELLTRQTNLILEYEYWINKIEQ